VVESGDLLACAYREFREETGLSIEGHTIQLKPVQQKNGKTVYAFAIEADLDLAHCCSNLFEMEWPPRSGKTQSFPEVDRVEYFDLKTAMKKIHAYQRPFLVELSRKLEIS
jgi:predicted NUDIX family NTP pyrophosphohydrolase